MAEERRLVSVLFADVSGSSGLAETIDPEDVRELLGRFYAIARESVAAHGGTLEKFIGDAVMAIFGVPRAHDDDAVRAVATALELRDRVRGDPTLGDRLPIRLGVSTGEVVASTDPSRGDFIVTGDAVNAAARLQQAASPWEILATARVARAARTQFRFGDPRAVEARGRRTPLVASPVVGPAQRRPPRRTRFVGRQADLDQLELAARRAFLTSRPSLVTVVAGPGAGKTRLIEEFARRRLGGVERRAVVATACCTSYGQRVTHEPLRALLIALLGLDEQLDAAALLTRTRDWLTACGDANATRHAELLTAAAGSGDAEIADRGALFAAWRTAIELAAGQRPLVLVLEDLHWASDTLLDLLEFVLEPTASAPLLVVVLARPELLDRRPAWGGGRANSIVLGLEPLERPEMRRLVGSLARDGARGMIDRIVDRAEGNPFFAEELVLAASERPAAGGLEGDLPDSVQGTILARLDLLDPDARRMLQVGSVLGRRFELAAVASMDPGPASAVEGGATTLARRDLVVRAADGALAFRHALIQNWRTRPCRGRSGPASTRPRAAGWRPVPMAARTRWPS